MSDRARTEFRALAERFVTLANELESEHGSARVSAAILYASSRYNARYVLVADSEAVGNRDAALAYLAEQYRNMFLDSFGELALSVVGVRTTTADEGKTVTCGAHGEARPAFVCHHLAARVGVAGPPVGFFEAAPCSDDEPDDEGADQAWCSECQGVLEHEGAWNDRSEGFARVTLLCSACFDDLRRAHGPTGGG